MRGGESLLACHRSCHHEGKEGDLDQHLRESIPDPKESNAIEARTQMETTTSNNERPRRLTFINTRLIQAIERHKALEHPHGRLFQRSPFIPLTLIFKRGI